MQTARSKKTWDPFRKQLERRSEKDIDDNNALVIDQLLT